MDVDPEGIGKLPRIFCDKFVHPCAVQGEDVIIEIQALHRVFFRANLDFREQVFHRPQPHIFAQAPEQFALGLVRAVGAVIRAAPTHEQAQALSVMVQDFLVVENLAVRERQLVKVFDQGPQRVAPDFAVFFHPEV